MKTIFGYASLLIVALAFWAGQGLADESGSDGSFSARVDAGVLWMKTESHLDAGDDNRRINSLTESPKSETEIIPVPAFELAWQVGENMVLYGGIPLEDEPRPTLGFQYGTEDFGEFDVSLFYHFPEDVWEDPYLTGVDRTETDMDRYGIKLAWEVDDLELSYELAFQDVDNDAVGARLPDLKREGEIHGFGAAYAFELGNGLALIPEIGMTLGNMDGRSSEYRGLIAGLGLMKHWGDLALMMSVEAGVID